MEQKNEWNNFRRLKWGAKNGYLYAYKPELKLYKKRLKYIVLVADFFFCTERFGEAETLATRMLNNEFSKLTPAQQDYPNFLIGSSWYWRFDRKKAFSFYEKVLTKIEGTYTEERAFFIAGNLSWFLKDPNAIKRGHEFLKELAYSKKKTENVYKAKLVYGFRMMQLGQTKEGKKVLGSLPKDAGGYKQSADLYLEQIKKSSTKQKGGKSNKRTDKPNEGA